MITLAYRLIFRIEQKLVFLTNQHFDSLLLLLVIDLSTPVL
jgi:hypothetical protein